MSVAYAAGAMYSSVNDLYRWNRFLLTRTPAIVEPATLTAMFTHPACCSIRPCPARTGTATAG